MRAAKILILLAAMVPGGAQPPNWPQFRGPGGTGVATLTDQPPVEFGAGRKMLWKTPLPAGHGSPSIWGNRIFLTAFDKENKKLETLALDRRSGKVLWRRPAPAEKIEEAHQISNPATSTPAVDGERVYVYFGSCGLFAYDLDGTPVWSVPMPVAKAVFGSGTSPIVHSDRVILNREEAGDPHLLVVDRKTGKTVWRQPQWAGQYPNPFSHSTPVVWNDQIVLHRSFEIVAFDLNTGTRRWWLKTMTQGNGSPVLGPDALYVGTWMNMGEPDLVVPLPAFDAVVSRYDRDGDGAISLEEFPTGSRTPTRTAR